jgi:acylglycerol lipase
MNGDFFAYLNSRGIEVFSFDQRGAGRSAPLPKQYGLSGPTSLVLSDLTSVLLTQLPSPVPVFLLGHSMGGSVMFTYACLGSPFILSHIRGFLGEAPDFGLPPGAVTAPSRFASLAANIAQYITPRLRVKVPLDPMSLSKVARERRRYMEDPLCHETVTLQGICGHFDRVEKLVSGQVKLNVAVKSVWIGHGTNDMCTSYDASEKWIEGLTLEDKTFKSYENALHSCETSCSSRCLDIR